MDADSHGSANLALWEQLRGFEQDLKDKLAKSVYISRVIIRPARDIDVIYRRGRECPTLAQVGFV